MADTQTHAPLRHDILSTLACVSVFALAGCASAPPPRTDVVRRLSPSEEADAIEAAKRHPIATTYERPRADSLPVAPPPIPAEPAPPAEAQQPPAPRDQVIIVGNEPAPPNPPAAAYRWPDTTPDYVDSPYAWVDGAWVARPGYRAYVETPWVGTGVGVGVSVGRPWGYGWGYGYNYGYPRAWGGYPYYRRPPVVVVPSRPLPPPRARYYGGYDRPSTRSPTYQSSPRREVYVAPRAPYRAPAAAPRPAYRAPAASSPRGGSGSVYRAPASAPRSSGSGAGGRRSVHVR